MLLSEICRCDHSVQNLMVSNNIYIKTFIIGLIGLKAWQFVWLRAEITTIVAYAISVLLCIIPLSAVNLEVFLKLVIGWSIIEN